MVCVEKEIDQTEETKTSCISLKAEMMLRFTHLVGVLIWLPLETSDRESQISLSTKFTRECKFPKCRKSIHVVPALAPVPRTIAVAYIVGIQ